MGYISDVRENICNFFYIYSLLSSKTGYSMSLFQKVYQGSHTHNQYKSTLELAHRQKKFSYI